VRHDDALNALLDAARGGDPALAAAALQGLSLRADEPAAAALEGIVRERGPDDAFGRLALYAIKGLPRDLALARLRKLQGDGDGAIAREAAYGLGRPGGDAGRATLLADLEEAKLRRRAQTLLTYLFCKDLGTEPWRFRSLFESQPVATHADHFLAALKEGGGNVPEGKDLRDRAFVPLLVAAIEDPRWFVRRSALEFLEAATGQSLGSLSVSAGKDEIAEVARRWREATTSQARGDEQR
jgi:HEAT repeat protein